MSSDYIFILLQALASMSIIGVAYFEKTRGGVLPSLDPFGIGQLKKGYATSQPTMLSLPFRVSRYRVISFHNLCISHFRR